MIKGFFISILCCFTIALFAQETVYVPDSTTIYFGNKISAGIFGYVRNNGNISMQEDAQVYFLGKIWTNEKDAKITDASTIQNSSAGGRITFYQPNPLFGNLGQQVMEAGYMDSTSTGPAFSNITIDNPAGVIITSDMAVLKNVHFTRGHVYLNNYNFVVGDSASFGKVSGYDQYKYFVTGIGVSGGFLKYRSVYSGAMASFPVGPTNTNYTPLQIINRGGSDNFFTRAFEKVFSGAVLGFVVADSTLQVTWQLGKSGFASSDVAVTLQHDILIEDPVFKTQRDMSYVSLYGNRKWDKPVFFTKPQIPGSISSSFSISSAMMNTRKFELTNAPIFLTKKVTKSRKSFEIPNVFSPNNDNINDRWNIKGLKDFDNCRVEIFNRYGQLVFSSVGYPQAWDGTYKGSPMPVATYYYVIHLRDGEQPIGGSVTILR